jgi:hypothetical protein
MIFFFLQHLYPFTNHFNIFAYLSLSNDLANIDPIMLKLLISELSPILDPYLGAFCRLSV